MPNPDPTELNSPSPSPRPKTTTPVLSQKIVEAKRKSCLPRLAADGYTTRSGSPTSTMVRLEGEKRWRRLMVWQFSNVGTLFLKITGKPVVVHDYMIPDIQEA